MRHLLLTAALVAALPIAPASAQRYRDAEGHVRVAIVGNPYSGSRSGSDFSGGPELLRTGGLEELLTGMGCRIERSTMVELTPDEKRAYGQWNRMGLANGHLWVEVAAAQKQGRFTIGVLANCNSLMGMLAGLQRSGPPLRPLRIGLVWIDAHGDFNTPETTLSGMLGGMPVAVSAGMCLTRLRLQSGLDPALPTKYITMVAVRDTDPLEQDLIDRSDIEHVTVEDVRSHPEEIRRQMDRLGALTDLIYVHVDMDVLDPEEVRGHPLTVPNGPTSEELAAALEVMFRHEKVAAFGVASTPHGPNDPEGISKKAAYTLIQGAVRGVQGREPERSR